MNLWHPACLLTCGVFFWAAAPASLTAADTAAAGSNAPALSRHDFSGQAMGTLFRISCYAADKARAEQVVSLCFARIEDLNRTFTDYDPTSELMRLCAPDARYPVPVSEPMADLLARSVRMARLTQGAFDPTCGHLSQLWRRTRRQHKLPPADRLQKAMAATDWRRIQFSADKRQVSLKPGTLLDLGGIAKGYAADECLRILKAQGLPCSIVIAGGDTAAGDAPPGQPGWEVTLRTSTAPGGPAPSVVHLANRAVSTSGDLYQFVEIDGVRYSHILSLKTGLGLTEPVACSVLANDCTTSDALATAMCALGEKAGTALAKQAFPEVEVRFTHPVRPGH